MLGTMGMNSSVGETFSTAAGQLLIPSGVGLVAAGLGSAGVLWCSAAALAGVGFAVRRITQNSAGPPPTPTEDDL